MRKYLFICIAVFMAAFITACGDDKGEAESDTTEASVEEDGQEDAEQEDDAEADEEDIGEHDFEKEFDEVIYDSDEIAVVLKKIRRESFWDLRERESYYINVEIENKLDTDIVISYEESEADGEDIHAVIRDNVNAQRKVDSVITIEDSWEEPLPLIEDYLEVNIKVLEEDGGGDFGIHTLRFDFNF